MFRNLPRDYLFSTRDMFGTLEAQKQGVKNAAENIPENRLRSESLDTLADEIAAKLLIEVPQLIESEISVSPPREVDVEIHGHQRMVYGFDGRGKVKGTEVTFTIPFKGDAEMFSVQPTTFTLNPPRAEVARSALEWKVSGPSLDQARVKSEFESFLRTVKEYLACQAKDVAQFNAGAKGLAYGALQARQQRLQKGDDLVSGLGYKVK